MTATSPYAPIPRNTYLIHVDSQNRRSVAQRKFLVVGSLLALVVRYYWARIREQNDVGTLKDLLRKWIKLAPSSITQIFQSAFQGMSSWIQSSTMMSSLSIDQGNRRRAVMVQGEVVGTNGCFPSSTVVISNQLKEQQNVLKFWFGQYAPDEAQKKFWMIAQQSTALREEVDSQINERFKILLYDLSDNELWKEWTRSAVYGFMGKIAAIVVLDQFSRHILRHEQSSANDSSPDVISKQSQFDAIALQVAELLTTEHAMEIQSGMIPIPMYIFSLMPFRHARSLETVKYVQEQVEVANGLLQQKDAMLRRFRKATNRRLAVLQDQARSTGDENKSEYTDEDILECFPFQPEDQSQITSHPVYQTVRTFLAKRGIHSTEESNTALQPADSSVSPTHEIPIIVSLSGGVDSMVIASVLSQMNRNGGYRLKVVAVHIDYANRPESAAEATYVKRYCKQLGIEYQCRRIGEVTRGVTARDEYERMSREIRYSFYRDTVSECLMEDANNKIHEVAVMLGHHRGDLRENVLSNAHKGCGPLDLSGMTEVSRNDGVTLYRPLLSLEKTFVYAYAHSFGVPYFKDTTPHWSTRGKLRNKLLPLLEEIYGEGSMNNLSNLAVESDECKNLVYGTVLKPFLDQVARKPMGILFRTRPWKDQGLFFWKFVLRETLHSAGLGMFSDKSVANFLQRIQAPILKEGWMQCRKDFGVYLRKDGTIFVFYPASFPWRKVDEYPCLGEKVECGEENSVEVGPWIVTAEDLGNELLGEETRDRLETRAIFSMEDLFEGSFEYYLNVPGRTIVEARRTLPLVFTKFKRNTRPKAWKGVDLKVQEALPLVGIDEKEMIASKLDDGNEHLVRVTVRLDIVNRSMTSY